MPPIRANSKDGHGHKDKYLETSRKTLSQEMFMCNMKNIISIMYLEVMKKKGQMSRSKGLVPTEKPYHKEHSCEISKLQHLLFNNNTKDLIFLNSKLKITGSKLLVPSLEPPVNYASFLSPLSKPTVDYALFFSPLSEPTLD